MIKNLGLKQKIFLLITSFISITLVVGFVGHNGLTKVNYSFGKITDSSLINIVLINEMSAAAAEVERTIFEGLLPDDPTMQKQTLAENIQLYQTKDKAYQDVPFAPGEDEYYNKVASAWKQYLESVDRFSALIGQPANSDKMTALISGEIKDRKRVYNKVLKDLVEFNQQNSKVWTEEAKESTRNATQVMIWLTILGSATALITGFTFAVRLSQNIASVTESLTTGAAQVSAASEQISSAAQTLSTSSTEQASSMEETVATMEELTAMVKLNTENAKSASTLSAAAREAAQKGEDEVKKLITSIQDISVNSQKISEITTVIDDIAFQTNLLALNAAVEAARAGEQGKGFAVVAEAVRNLAQRSAESAKNIAQLIDSSVSQVKKGSDQAVQSGNVLDEILVSIKKVSELNNEIYNASKEQENGITQIGQAMNQLDQATQQNAAVSEESAAASQQLSSQASELNENSLQLKLIVYGLKKSEDEFKALT